MRKVISRYNAFGKRIEDDPPPFDLPHHLPFVWIPNKVYAIYRRVAKESRDRKRDKK